MVARKTIRAAVAEIYFSGSPVPAGSPPAPPKVTSEAGTDPRTGQTDTCCSSIKKHTSTSRLEGVDPEDRVQTSQAEDDLLEIPAFLRRQASNWHIPWKS